MRWVISSLSLPRASLMDFTGGSRIHDLSPLRGSPWELCCLYVLLVRFKLSVLDRTCFSFPALIPDHIMTAVWKQNLKIPDLCKVYFLSQPGLPHWHLMRMHCLLRVIKKSDDFVGLTIGDPFLDQPRFVHLFMSRFLYFRQQVKAALTPQQPLSLLSWLA